MEEVAGQWNGDESGKQEEDAQAANEVLDLVARIEEIMTDELQYTLTKTTSQKYEMPGFEDAVLGLDALSAIKPE